LKVLLDTDVLLDVALARPNYGPESRAVVEWCYHLPQTAVVAWHTISNLFYLLRAARSDSVARAFIHELMDFVDVAAGGRLEVRQALQLPLADFEDALQVAAALSAGSDFIITRNVRHYRRSPLPAVTPRAFLHKFSVK
jgi:predicted nucleic acid-binding protein